MYLLEKIKKKLKKNFNLIDSSSNININNTARATVERTLKPWLVLNN